MIREDYLLRLIRQVILAVVGSRRQRQEAAQEQALEALDAAARSLLGLDVSLLGRVPLPTLSGLLSPGNEPDAARILAAGLLLVERSRVLEALGRPDPAGTLAARGEALIAQALALAPELRQELQDMLAEPGD